MDAREYMERSETRLDELYHANSKHQSIGLSFATDVQKAARDRYVHAVHAASTERYKTYTAFDTIELPRRLRPLTLSLDDAIAGRRSQRTFRGEAVSAIEVGTLLARSYGSCGVRQGSVARAVPSGGGIYPLDLYVLQFAGGAIDEGLYHYHVGKHALQRVALRCARPGAEEASLYPEIVAQAAMLLVVVADMKRVRAKYGERSYRLALLEAGHVSQNLYLVAGGLGLGIVALDGFFDDRVHDILGVDGVAEIALMVFAVGRLP